MSIHLEDIPIRKEVAFEISVYTDITGYFADVRFLNGEALTTIHEESEALCKEKAKQYIEDINNY